MAITIPTEYFQFFFCSAGAHVEVLINSYRMVNKIEMISVDDKLFPVIRKIDLSKATRFEFQFNFLCWNMADTVHMVHKLNY